MLFLHGFCSKFFVYSVSLTRSGISLREGQPDKLLKLGRCFWKKHLFFFEKKKKKKKKPHHGSPAGLRLFLAASFLTCENPGTSSKATFLCMVKARVSVGGRPESRVTGFDCAALTSYTKGMWTHSWYFTSFCLGAVSVGKKLTRENMDTALKFFLPYIQCLISWF